MAYDWERLKQELPIFSVLIDILAHMDSRVGMLEDMLRSVGLLVPPDGNAPDLTAAVSNVLTNAIAQSGSGEPLLTMQSDTGGHVPLPATGPAENATAGSQQQPALASEPVAYEHLRLEECSRFSRLLTVLPVSKKRLTTSLRSLFGEMTFLKPRELRAQLMQQYPHVFQQDTQCTSSQLTRLVMERAEQHPMSMHPVLMHAYVRNRAHWKKRGELQRPCPGKKDEHELIDECPMLDAAKWFYELMQTTAKSPSSELDDGHDGNSDCQSPQDDRRGEDGHGSNGGSSGSGGSKVCSAGAAGVTGNISSGSNSAVGGAGDTDILPGASRGNGIQAPPGDELMTLERSAKRQRIASPVPTIQLSRLGLASSSTLTMLPFSDEILSMIS